MALVDGTNCGFVENAPVADPAGSNYWVDTISTACNFTSPATATRVTELGWYCNGATEAADYDIGIYTDNAGEPDAVVHISANNAKGTTEGWKKVTGLDIEISPNTPYWLAVQVDDTDTATNVDGAINALYTRKYKTSQTALPNPSWGASSMQTNRVLAIYAVWEAGEPPVGNAGIMTCNTGFWGATY
jgi:hypothetical protein